MKTKLAILLTAVFIFYSFSTLSTFYHFSFQVSIFSMLLCIASGLGVVYVYLTKDIK